MSNNALRIVAISGSLRKASINRALLEAAGDLAPTGLSVEILGLGEIQVLRREEFDALLQSMERIQKEGGVLPIQPAADEAAKAMERAATAMENAATAMQEQAEQPRTVNINQQNAKFIGSDAASRARRVTNGQSKLLRRAQY